jgi:transposase InsO family protein
MQSGIEASWNQNITASDRSRNRTDTQIALLLSADVLTILCTHVASAHPFGKCSFLILDGLFGLIFVTEGVAIEAGQSLKGEDVVRVLNRVKQQRGVPKFLFCDNGSEFTSQAMDLWAYQNGMKIDFSRPGKSTDNAFVESFNGTFRAECLNAHWFGTLAEAKRLIEAWRQEYNESRPHRSLGERTPREFASEYAASRALTAT